MKLVQRVGVTTLAVAALSVFAAPIAGAATTDATARDNGKIRVCIEDVRDDARVRVGGKSKTIDDGECYTFRNLDRGRVYRVSVDVRDRGRDAEVWVRAERDARKITYYGESNGRGRYNDRDRRDDRWDDDYRDRGFNDRNDNRFDRYNDRFDRSDRRDGGSGYWDDRD